MKKIKRQIIPDLKEFTDEEGKKWIQTSADDLFSTNELNEIISSMEKDKGGKEIVLARIDFQKVNKEYYETVLDLQEQLRKQNESLKNLLVNAKDTIDRKNKKLKELVDYIRKLHILLAYYKLKPEDAERIIPSPDSIIYEPAAAPAAIKKKSEEAGDVIEKRIIEYAEVEEILLDEEGNEKGPA